MRYLVQLRRGEARLAPTWRYMLLWVLLITMFGAVGLHAQGGDFTATIGVESGFVRAAPARDAEVVASVFEDNPLLVVGRNLDGSWFQVRRLGRMNNLGWVSNTLLFYDFLPETLPLTDVTTGATGEARLSADPGFAAYFLENTNMRAQPTLESDRLGLIPFSAVVPVLERNEDGSWLRVHYLGAEGWISAFYVRELPNVMDVPLAANLPVVPTSGAAIVIPPEVQIGEVQELRDYTLRQRDFTFGLESFWNVVLTGEIMPCEPPPFVVEYLYSDDDERAFPELDYLVPRLDDGVAYINSSIEPMYTCGVVNPNLVRDARNAAINGRVVFDATLGVLDNIEALIRNR